MCLNFNCQMLIWCFRTEKDTYLSEFCILVHYIASLTWAPWTPHIHNMLLPTELMKNCVFSNKQLSLKQGLQFMSRKKKTQIRLEHSFSPLYTYCIIVSVVIMAIYSGAACGLH